MLGISDYLWRLVPANPILLRVVSTAGKRRRDSSPVMRPVRSPLETARPFWGLFLLGLGAGILLLLVLFGLSIWSFFIEPNRLVIRQEAIQINDWPKELGGLRIALIADIHSGGPFINDKKLHEIVERTNQLNPDLIVLLGDYMSPNSWHSHRVEPEVTAAALKDLHASLGVYSVLGNHDWWYNGNKVRTAFEQKGIHVLENEVEEIKWRERSFWLVGLGRRCGKIGRACKQGGTE